MGNSTQDFFFSEARIFSELNKKWEFLHEIFIHHCSETDVTRDEKDVTYSGGRGFAATPKKWLHIVEKCFRNKIGTYISKHLLF